jgi:hypothetical protein
MRKKGKKLEEEDKETTTDKQEEEKASKKRGHFFSHLICLLCDASAINEPFSTDPSANVLFESFLIYYLETIVCISLICLIGLTRQ